MFCDPLRVYTTIQIKPENVPEVIVFLNGRLLSEVTLLLSAERSTDGSGAGVSEWERS